ncbi:1,4-alpha-glucan branching protein GlgB [Microbacterium amylolyticum]|uniref:1,4-alpha-glucan branching enzyme GlgB n=1 Tax=Microbacterium amylolyticum TaxID=936337 RepID=A0ABS4ZGS7_9MICO|nr:1,4-alpha-glucan branching protein GlgB [Microbacterium amylolyticum]MBP2436484.1 1,4-alpha-glucan branching enzyme [Microbacterium amylolyticum]
MGVDSDDGDFSTGSRGGNGMTIGAAPIPDDVLAMIAEGRHGDPHVVLGGHPYDGGVTVRVLKPLADAVVVRFSGGDVSLVHEAHGIWVGVLPVPEVPDYRVVVNYADGVAHELDDPYRFLPTVSDLDLYLFGEGRHEELWRALGARTMTIGEVSGTAFAVWAPNARAVRLKSESNGWDGREHPMRQLGTSGVWELFVPGIGMGAHYKYAILSAAGEWLERADPMASWAEVPPATASRVHTSSYVWGDEAWLVRRAKKQAIHEPMSIYEVHLGSWRRGLSYEQLADQLVAHVRETGFTHVELMPVMQHPFGGSWGYHVTGYYAPDSRFGDPDGLRLLIDRLHQADIGVILDWVPGHFATDEWALARFDGEPLYEDPNPQRGWHKEWGSHIFNFGRHEVRNFLVANALHWLEEFHADGLRVDGVASMLYLDYSREDGEWSPNAYGGRENLEAVALLQELTATAYRRNPGTTIIAEESTAWPGVTKPTDHGGLGFGFKWNMGWMHDTLEYVSHDPIHRSYHHHEMTFAAMYGWSENYVLPLSHDEVVHGKGSILSKVPGDRWRQLATARALYGFMWAFPGKQLLFMGSEFAQESEWAESRELDWWLLDLPDHRGVLSALSDLNARYRETPALWAWEDDPRTFSWIDGDAAGHNVFSFVRRSSDSDDASQLVCVSNFAAMPHHGFRLGLPHTGVWEEIVNTDATQYAGSGVGNLGRIEAVAGEHNGQPARADISIPPLATVWFRARG